MEKILEVVNFILNNGVMFVAGLGVILASLIGLCSALVAFFMMIPGAQPEKSIDAFKQKLVGLVNGVESFRQFISKYSKKPQA